MKYLLSFILLGCLISCGLPKENRVHVSDSAMIITVDSFIFNGHQYYLWKQGYDCFSAEHRVDCKKCLDKFD